jgi:hypothetical protein
MIYLLVSVEVLLGLGIIIWLMLNQCKRLEVEIDEKNESYISFLISKEFKRYFGDNLIGECYDYLPADSKLRKLLRGVIGDLMKKYKDEINKIKSEAFIDEVIDRINRKQVIK